MSVIRTARERARDEVTAAIKEEARRQLADEGASRLSLRAVARELGMVSSALYRYFPSRDELLTALIIDAYDAVGAAAEEALARAGGDPVERWSEVCRAVRRWALGHPHEYALIYGSPVPGYSAPLDTIGPASRVGLALIAVAEQAHTAGALAAAPADAPLSEAAHADAWRLSKDLDRDLPARAIPSLVAAWAQLFGLVSFEVFGQFNNVVEARDDFFDHAVAGLAHQAGLRRERVLHGE
ncbi:TetR/AcrR family transcriptional regulator [Streptomyces sp. PA03-1a]|nr:TetR/AcrR family transcriptional regulator [Streptomyces sp. PA03-1a]MDX2813568.1 TetR/AcrR family transcriptional regulator [Streptomyces sp. PA03-5A]